MACFLSSRRGDDDDDDDDASFCSLACRFGFDGGVRLRVLALAVIDGDAELAADSIRSRIMIGVLRPGCDDEVDEADDDDELDDEEDEDDGDEMFVGCWAMLYEAVCGLLSGWNCVVDCPVGFIRCGSVIIVRGFVGI